MLKYLELVLFLCLLGLALPAFGADAQPAKFDPTDFLKEQEFKAAERRAAEAIEASKVVIGGRNYIRLTGLQGTIYVPQHDDLEIEDLDTAICDTSFRPTDLALALQSAADLRLVEAVSRSTGVILDAIRAKCRNKL